MASVSDQLKKVKAVYSSCHKHTSAEEKISFYDNWAENYEQDAAVLEYSAPVLAAKTITTHFSGDRDAAVVLDVACGTGLVAKQLKKDGFSDFVGHDGSPGMLQKAKETGLYKELKLCIIGEKPLPVPKASFDVVLLSGALSVGHIHYSAVRQLCEVCKPGGYICLTCRDGEDNVKYKAALEQELRQMEEQGLWVCVELTKIQNWEKPTSENEDCYISGTVYLYRKL